MQKAYKSVKDYMADQPAEVRAILEELRQAIIKAAPDAEEVISYNMPAYKYHGMLVYFAGHKKHIGFYPTGSGIEAFKKELAGYKGSKGAVQFPFDKPLPLKLITQIVKFRVKINLDKAKNGTKKKY